jgi:hypothetical protein
MSDPAPTAPSGPVQTKTQTAFVTLNMITQACHGILNTTFVPPPQKPSWFDALAANLDTAKKVATNWVDDLAPGITGGVPLAVVNYGTTYAAMNSQIQSVVQAHPDAQGASDPYVIQVHQLVDALEQEISQLLTDAQSSADQLKTWGDSMQSAHDALSTGATNIQAAEVDLQTDITKMNTAIDTLNKEIHDENMAIAGSAAGIGLGLILLVAGIALAPETGGGSLVVAGTGGLLIAGGAITWGIMQHKINEQYGEIAQDQQEHDADERQLVALQGLATSSNQAITYTVDATSALSDFRTSWAVFQGELQGVKTDLEKADKSLSTIVSGAFTDAAAGEWALATDFAQGLADAKVSVATAQLPMNSKMAA